MKLLKLLTILFIASISNNLLAQLPPNPFAIYEFTNGSLDNTAPTEAGDFTGSILSTVDRHSTNNAAEPITSVLTGTSLGLNNVNNSTVSLWFKIDSLIQDQVIYQIYGVSGRGYRVLFNGNKIYLAANVGSTGGSISLTKTDSFSIDYTQWQHLTVTTEFVVGGTGNIQIKAYLNNTILPNISMILTPGGGINNFLRTATSVT